MQELNQIGKILIFLGAFFLLLGLGFLFFGKVPWIGKLPGDIVIEKKNFTFYFPITTGILFSLLLSLILWIMSRK
ncbi:MAG TPA: DUF2905 domain-containing protein [Nitrospiria bacterium]